MNIRLNLAILPLYLCLSLSVSAQKKIVVLGSSTAAGTGASTFANSWVGKMTSYYNKNVSDGVDTTVVNLSMGGNHTYSIVPSGFTPPPGRPFTDDSRNITAALAQSPDVIIVNLPTNDAFYASNNTWTGYTIKETMDNFRLVESLARGAHVPIFFATTQPRNLSTEYRDTLRRTKDSIIASFGVSRTIDFWTDLTETDGSNLMLASVNSGDGVHVNDLGHNFLYTRVINKNIFGTYLFLPVQLLQFNATPVNNQVRLSWAIEQEDPNTKYEVERSSDGIRFSLKSVLQGSGSFQQKSYAWNDLQPESGMNYYRLHIREAQTETYSRTVAVAFRSTALTLSKLYTSTSDDQLYFTVGTGDEQTVDLRIVSSNGAVLERQTLTVHSGEQQYHIPLSHLTHGMYFLQVTDQHSHAKSGSFTKL
jgi:lysophospholipase L1-like esterase